MANQTQTRTGSQKPSNPGKPEPQKATEAAKTETAAQPATETANTNAGPTPEQLAKLKRVRLESPTIPGLFVRMTPEDYAKFGPGAVLGKDGVALVWNGSGGKKPTSNAEKEAEKAKLEAMSVEERAAYQKQKREAAQAERTAKKAKEQEALIERLKKEILEGKHGPVS